MRELEVHPNFFNCKKTSKKCNPPDFKFYLGKLNNKKFPHIVYNVNFVSVFTALKGKDYKNTLEFCLKVFANLKILKQTAWKSYIYF